MRKRTGRAMKLDNLITDVNMVLRAQADRACELMTLKIDKLGGLSQVVGFSTESALGDCRRETALALRA
ncbi:MAG TPA: hypothetical protein DIW77_18680 [Chromatiaceae bacterium]|nr:MAG: hypothetical protein N838_23835 [Thiohalocapsa sp. PB-PSB1]HCS91992.1 hypothetical protein [Chromatiaceae bacterium]